MGPINGFAIFAYVAYLIQSGEHPVRNATVDDILFKAAYRIHKRFGLNGSGSIDWY
jgi:hypothetical protein